MKGGGTALTLSILRWTVGHLRQSWIKYTTGSRCRGRQGVPLAGSGGIAWLVWPAVSECCRSRFLRPLAGDKPMQQAQNLRAPLGVE